MTSVVFSIIDGDGLALAIDPNNPKHGGQLLVQAPEPKNPDQQWTWVYIPSQQAVALFNPGRNLFAAPGMLVAGGPVVLFNPDMPFYAATTWRVITDARSAIRPATGDDLNLNVPDEGRSVVVAPWGGGAPNEVWTSQILAT